MHPTSRNVLATVLAAGLAQPLFAQDLLAVTWSGTNYLVDSYTGAVTSLGTGLSGQNALARDAGGTLWSTSRTGPTSAYVWSLTTIDPSTGAATIVHAGIDLRGLAQAPAGMLYGINDLGSSDALVLIDLATGVITPIGPTGFGAIQALASHQGTVYAWDINQGLLLVDPLTGTAVDPFPAVTGPAGLQGMCSHPDGRLLVGRENLYVVDPTTGLTTLIGSMNNLDIRGIEVLGAGTISPFGQGCNGVGGPVTLTVTGQAQAGGTLQTLSANHAPNGFGIVCLGISTTWYLGVPLPFLLDPTMGTSGCTLYTSIDAPVLVLPTLPDQLLWSMTLGAAAAGATFHLQHAYFEAVPGNMSWSNGVTVQVQ
jgi:hypothetical protein